VRNLTAAPGYIPSLPSHEKWRLGIAARIGRHGRESSFDRGRTTANRARIYTQYLQNGFSFLRKIYMHLSRIQDLLRELVQHGWNRGLSRDFLHQVEFFLEDLYV